MSFDVTRDPTTVWGFNDDKTILFSSASSQVGTQERTTGKYYAEFHVERRWDKCRMDQGAQIQGTGLGVSSGQQFSFASEVDQWTHGDQIIHTVNSGTGGIDLRIVSSSYLQLTLRNAAGVIVGQVSTPLSGTRYYQNYQFCGTVDLTAPTVEQALKLYRNGHEVQTYNIRTYTQNETIDFGPTALHSISGNADGTNPIWEALSYYMVWPQAIDWSESGKTLGLLLKERFDQEGFAEIGSTPLLAIQSPASLMNSANANAGTGNVFTNVGVAAVDRAFNLYAVSLGIASPDQTIAEGEHGTTRVGLHYDGIRGWQSQSHGYYFGGAEQGKTLRAAFNLDDALYYLQLDLNGSWNAFNDDPTVNSSGAPIGALPAPYKLVATAYSGTVISMRTTADEFQYPVPAGYEPWGAAGTVDPPVEPATRPRRTVLWF